MNKQTNSEPVHLSRGKQWLKEQIAKVRAKAVKAYMVYEKTNKDSDFTNASELTREAMGWQGQCRKHVYDRVKQTRRIACTICGVQGGWYCPKSEDRCCHYTTKGGNFCIHCKQPCKRRT